LIFLEGFQGDFMYQGPPSQTYNDYLMQQELHQRLSYGPPPPQGPPPPAGMYLLYNKKTIEIY
jgi:hypothetical protein